MVRNVLESIGIGEVSARVKGAVSGLALLLSALAIISFGSSVSAHADDDSGAVYVLTNSRAGNAVIVYSRAENGALTPAGSYATGGLGNGAGLGSQGAVVVSDDHRLLVAVNAGSNSVSTFRVHNTSLELIDTKPSGGILPISVTVRGGFVYALNAGVPNNVTGFRVSGGGQLTPLDGSTRSLSGDSTNPAQVGFSDDGRSLIVTEKGTNIIDSYDVGDDGRVNGPFINASAGQTPFGFAVGQRNTLLVSEAGANSGASTYRIDHDSDLDLVSGMIVTGQRAACWAILTPNGRFGYVTNAGTGNISGIAVAHDGSGRLLNADGITAVTGGNPTDVAMSADGHYLYARVSALGQIAIFRIEPDGSLSPRSPLAATPGGLAGLAGF
jgi:6-phosphogluconolactonase